MGYYRWRFSCREQEGKVFNTIRHSKLQAIFRRDITAATETARRLGATKGYASVDELVNDPNVDAIYIATPPGLHLEQALLCCKAKKPTYIEKPLARSYEELLALVKAFEQSQIPLFVAHYRRAIKRFQKLKQILDSGKIGKPIEIDFRMCREYPSDPIKGADDWIYDPKMSGGGKFFDIAPHTLIY